MEKKETRPRIKSKVWIESERGPLLGKGGANLLRSIQDTGSIKKAAEEVNWSYKFAWSYLKKLEERGASPIVKSFKGGKDRGGTKITPYAMKLLKFYEKVQKIIHSTSKKMVSYKSHGFMGKIKKKVQAEVVKVKKGRKEAKIILDVKKPLTIEGTFDEELPEEGDLINLDSPSSFLAMEKESYEKIDQIEDARKEDNSHEKD